MARALTQPDELDPEADDLIGTPPRRAHTSDGQPRRNSAEDAHPGDPYAVTTGELRQFIERWERLEAEKKDIADQQKEIMDEAKGRGYDTKAIRKIIAERKIKPDVLAELNSVLDVYRHAMGMI